jgi:hypothetical protein
MLVGRARLPGKRHSTQKCQRRNANDARQTVSQLMNGHSLSVRHLWAGFDWPTLLPPTPRCLAYDSCKPKAITISGIL